MARKNENSAAARAVQAHQQPADDRRARTRDARNERQRLEHADAERACHRRPIGVVHDGRADDTLDGQHHQASEDERPTEHNRALVEDGRDEITEQQPRNHRRQERHEQHDGESTCLGPKEQARRHRDDSLAIEPHHRQDRAQLNHDGEHAARIVVAQQLSTNEQVRRRRNRQKLGQTLDDAEDCRLEV